MSNLKETLLTINTPTQRRSLIKGAAVAAGALSAPMLATAQTTTSFRFQSTWPAKDIFHEYANDFAKKALKVSKPSFNGPMAVFAMARKI